MLLACSITASYRDNNEDRVFTCSNPQVIAVFDGMGGPGNGEQASSAAQEALQSYLENNPCPNSEEDIKYYLRLAVQEANTAVRLKTGNNYSAGTTATVCLVKEKTAYLVSIGDSRCYHFSNNKLILRSTDDAPYSRSIQDCLDRVLTVDDFNGDESLIDAFMSRNQLSACLGHYLNSYMIRSQSFTIQENDILFVSSDGVHDNLAFQELEKLFIEYQNDLKALAVNIETRTLKRIKEETLRSKDDDISFALLQ